MRSGALRRSVWPRVCTDVSAVSQILPRTHVWCSGRMCTLLFGIPSLGPPQFPPGPARFLSLSLSLSLSLTLSPSPPLSPSKRLLRGFSAAPLSLSLSLSRFSPSFTLFHTLKFSHVLTRLSDTSDCVGVRSDQKNLPAPETLRAQRHPTVHSAAACPHRVHHGGPAEQWFKGAGGELKGRGALTWRHTVSHVDEVFVFKSRYKGKKVFSFMQMKDLENI